MIEFLFSKRWIVHTHTHTVLWDIVSVKKTIWSSRRLIWMGGGMAGGGWFWQYSYSLVHQMAGKARHLQHHQLCHWRWAKPTSHLPQLLKGEDGWKWEERCRWSCCSKIRQTRAHTQAHAQTHTKKGENTYPPNDNMNKKLRGCNKIVLTPFVEQMRRQGTKKKNGGQRGERRTVSLEPQCGSYIFLV